MPHTRIEPLESRKTTKTAGGGINGRRRRENRGIEAPAAEGGSNDDNRVIEQRLGCEERWQQSDLRTTTQLLQRPHKHHPQTFWTSMGHKYVMNIYFIALMLKHNRKYKGWTIEMVPRCMQWELCSLPRRRMLYGE